MKWPWVVAIISAVLPVLIAVIYFWGFPLQDHASEAEQIEYYKNLQFFTVLPLIGFVCWVIIGLMTFLLLYQPEGRKMMAGGAISLFSSSAVWLSIEALLEPNWPIKLIALGAAIISYGVVCAIIKNAIELAQAQEQ